MAWTWSYLGTDGNPMSAASLPEVPSFPNQADAETWLGEEWSELRDAGVDQVVLLEDGRTVYGPMSLQPPG